MPFETAVREAGAFAIMPSYNEVDGIPSHANRALIEGIVRKEWGFTGLIVSDYYGIEQLVSRHRVASDRAAAAISSSAAARRRCGAARCPPTAASGAG